MFKTDLYLKMLQQSLNDIDFYQCRQNEPDYNERYSRLYNSILAFMDKSYAIKAVLESDYPLKRDLINKFFESSPPFDITSLLPTLSGLIDNGFRFEKWMANDLKHSLEGKKGQKKGEKWYETHSGLIAATHIFGTYDSDKGRENLQKTNQRVNLLKEKPGLILMHVQENPKDAYDSFFYKNVEVSVICKNALKKLNNFIEKELK